MLPVALSGFSSSAEGVRSVGWVSPPGVVGETWLVTLGAKQDSVPRAYRVMDGELRAEEGPLPFRSQVVARFRAASQVRVVRAWRTLFGVFAAVSIGVIAVAFLSGSFQLRLVLSDSMSGTFERGDVLAVVSPRFVELDQGSIVVFHYYDTDRSTLVGDFSHRIIGGSAETGWETKGDANAVPDLSPVLRQDVIGAVVGWVPKFGFLIQPSSLLIAALLVLVLMVAGPEIRHLRTLRNGKK